MPKQQLPEDAVKIDKYGKHELAGLYYSPSNRCFYNSYKIVRKVNVNGRNGFYTRMKGDAEKARTLYISMAKLLKEHTELVDIIDWTKPERAKGKRTAKNTEHGVAEQNAEPAADGGANEEPADVLEESEIKIEDDGEPAPEPVKPKKTKGIDYDSAFKAMRNATSQK